ADAPLPLDVGMHAREGHLIDCRSFQMSPVEISPARPFAYWTSNGSDGLDDQQFYAALIRSAAYSAIIIVGPFKFPDGISGMIDESATRNPATPFTRSDGSTTAISSVPILHAPDGCTAVWTVSRTKCSISL